MIGQDVCGKIPIVLIGKQEVVDLKDKLDKEDLKTSRWTCSRPQGQGGQGEFAQHGRESPLSSTAKDHQRLCSPFAATFRYFGLLSTANK